MKIFIYSDKYSDGEDVGAITYFLPEGILLEQAQQNNFELLCVVDVDINAESNQELAHALETEGLYYSGVGRLLLPT